MRYILESAESSSSISTSSWSRELKCRNIDTIFDYCVWCVSGVRRPFSVTVSLLCSAFNCSDWYSDEAGEVNLLTDKLGKAGLVIQEENINLKKKLPRIME